MFGKKGKQQMKSVSCMISLEKKERYMKMFFSAVIVKISIFSAKQKREWRNKNNIFPAQQQRFDHFDMVKPHIRLRNFKKGGVTLSQGHKCLFIILKSGDLLQ